MFFVALSEHKAFRRGDTHFCTKMSDGKAIVLKVSDLRFSVMLVGYMRVSTADDRQSVNLQRDALISAGVDERHLHADRASGSRAGRPGLVRCLEDLRSGDVLVVWKLDRLGRSLPHLVQLIEDLKMRGIGFRSLTEQMDTTSAHGEFLFALFGALAQYERSLIRERVNAGLAAARRRGRKLGRPQAISDEMFEQIQAALDTGSSKSAVARSFRISRSTLNDTLARRAPYE
ncbi:recombinase family protein [Nitratireductor rhodophyticola]